MLRDLSWLKRVKLIDADGDLINESNPLPVQNITLYNLKYTSDTDFGKGTLLDAEIFDTGDNAYIGLEDYGENDDDIDFSVSGDYTVSDGSKIEVNGGQVRLKSTIGSSINYPFTTPTNYTYDSNKIEITGRLSQLKRQIDESYLQLHCHLNEGSGTTVYDSSTHSRNGTMINMDNTNWVSGKFDDCLSFNGLDEHVEFGNILNFSKEQPFSLECWFKTTNGCPYSGLGHLIGKQGFSGSKTGYGLGMHADGSFSFILMHGITGNNLIQVKTVSTGWNDNSWHHIVVTYNGSSSASGCKVYIDGSNQTLTTIYDNLTDEITSNYEFHLGSRDGTGNYYGGLLDECVVYNKVLSSTEISFRYNSGTGTQGWYYTDYPTIVGNTGLAFTSALNIFTETSVIPTNTNIKYHISDNNGVTWKYWNGASWVVTDNSYTQANLASEINTNISSLGASGTFKFRALLSTNSAGTATPQLDNLYISEPSIYSTDDNLYVETKDASHISPAHILEWLTNTVSYSLPANTDIKLLLSINGRSSWLTWNGSIWTAPTDAVQRQYATSITDLQNNFSDLNLGDGTLDIRIFLYTSDNTVTSYVSNINIISEAGFVTSGYFESDVYDSTFYSLDWSNVEFNIELPIGTTIIIKARGSNDSVDLGSYGSALVNGGDTNIIGRYIQFKVEFTTTDETKTSKLNDISFNYSIPSRQEERP